MSSFEDRKDAFENKYAHDQQMMFRAEARACKLFGLWAAEQMGMDSDHAAAYAKEIVGANLEESGFNDVKRKILPDFKAKGVDISEHVIDRQLEKFLVEAKIQLMTEK